MIPHVIVGDLEMLSSELCETWLPRTLSCVDVKRKWGSGHWWSKKSNSLHNKAVIYRLSKHQTVSQILGLEKKQKPSEQHLLFSSCCWISLKQIWAQKCSWLSHLPDHLAAQFSGMLGNRQNWPEHTYTQISLEEMWQCGRTLWTFWTRYAFEGLWLQVLV